MERARVSSNLQLRFNSEATEYKRRASFRPGKGPPFHIRTKAQADRDELFDPELVTAPDSLRGCQSSTVLGVVLGTSNSVTESLDRLALAYSDDKTTRKRQGVSNGKEDIKA